MNGTFVSATLLINGEEIDCDLSGNLDYSFAEKYDNSEPVESKMASAEMSFSMTPKDEKEYSYFFNSLAYDYMIGAFEEFNNIYGCQA